jgi:hypothetical protein
MSQIFINPLQSLSSVYPLMASLDSPILSIGVVNVRRESMSKLFVRLLASGAIAASMGATVLADGASINLTGPGSTNIVTSSNRNTFSQRLNNWVGLGNYNYQRASTGNVWVSGNTAVWGSGLGSGNAINTNMGQNNVNIDNTGANMGVSMVPWSFGGGSMGGSIYLTGPHSTNIISGSNSNRFSSNTNNNVSTVNQNSQQATSGGVNITGNTVVTGVGGSGAAVNENSGTNTVDLANSSPTLISTGNNGGCDAGSISTTGPGSFNRIGCSNSNSASFNTNNNVSAANFNQQTARSGSVTISGNTVVSGVSGSGTAFNSNSGENNVGISN